MLLYLPRTAVSGLQEATINPGGFLARCVLQACDDHTTKSERGKETVGHVRK